MNDMFEMLVQRSNPVTPLTPVSTPPGPHHHHHHHASVDLSPRSSNSSFGSDGVLHHNESLHSPNNSNNNNSSSNRTEELSALQRLQVALARDGLFSSMTFEHVKRESHPDDPDGRMLVNPCSGSSSSSLANSPDEDANDSGEIPSSPSSNGLKTATPTTSPISDGNASNIFECPLCSVVCNSRHDFNEHLVTHSQQFACPKCTFFSDDETKLREHVAESHDASDLDVLTDDDVRTPKTNSQGKMKTFKCKQCGYHAVTKMDFWEHTKGHIRTEKMLTCPKCPFVTEYKHHLEYHLRNHFGSKPFQCTKCSYSCVNKSMLNSHLKSHSNIYQYRCADCSYATKYCHSLKLHLRKYDHKPSMVLNPDGTPNPLPIIDVYGTRRGPKIKRQDPESACDMGSTTLSPITPKEKSKNQRATPRRQVKGSSGGDSPKIKTETSNNTPPISPPQFAPRDIKQEFPMSPTMSMNQHQHIIMSPNNRNNSHPVDEKPFMLSNEQISANLLMQQFPHGLPIHMASQLNPANLQQLLIQNSVNGLNSQNNSNLAALQSLLMQSSANMPGLELVGKNPMELYATALNQYMVANNPVMNLSKLVEEQRALLVSQLLHQQQQQKSLVMKTPPAEPPQQQRSPQLQHPTPPLTNVHALDLRNKRPAEPTSSEAVAAPEDVKKRKRKGKALRYDRNKEEYDMSNKVCNQVLDFSNNNYTTTNRNVHNGDSNKTEPAKKADVDSENYICKYCDIAFPPVLYALHMRFHSSDVDPFRCNVCGTKSSDKVSFFVHLATASH